MPPPLKPVGECIAVWTPNGLRVDRADPRILVSAELVEQLMGPDLAIDGHLLRIEGFNRTAVYRIGEKVPNMFAYYAEWPD